MRNKQERIKELEEKLARLRELKKKIEQKIKKEQTLAVRYAKEMAYWYLEATEYDNAEKVAIEYLKEALCSRAKYKEECLRKKLGLIVEYSDQFKRAHKLAKKLLSYLEREAKKES